MAVRSVSLVDKVEFDFQGTIYRNALAFGDVDGDGWNELAVCNTSGHLLFFKEKSPKPWRVCNDNLGCVTTVLVGDATNCSSDSTVCLNTEGRCFIFSQADVRENEKRRQDGPCDDAKSNKKDSKISPSHQSDILIKPSFVQDLPSNPKMAIIADIDGDDQKELVICYSDRFVRVFRFSACQPPAFERKQSRDELQESTSSVKKLIQQPSKDEESSKTPSPIPPQHGAKNTGKEEFSFDFASRKFELLQEFYLPGQIGSVAYVKSSEKHMQLIAAQPAGGYAVLAVYNIDSVDGVKHHQNKGKVECVQITQLDVLYPSSVVGSRHLNVNCDVIGPIKRSHEHSGMFYTSTLDGHYALVDTSAGRGQRPVARATEHQWFKMDKVQNSDGDDVVILCSWDGMTHIVNKNFESSSYNFGENICGFCAGGYRVGSQRNVLCFCYVTFSNKIVLYHNVEHTFEKPKDLYEVLNEKLKGRPGMEDALETLTDGTGNIDHRKVLKLLQPSLRESK